MENIFLWDEYVELHWFIHICNRICSTRLTWISGNSRQSFMRIISKKHSRCALQQCYRHWQRISINHKHVMQALRKVRYAEVETVRRDRGPSIFTTETRLYAGKPQAWLLLTQFSANAITICRRVFSRHLKLSHFFLPLFPIVAVRLRASIVCYLHRTLTREHHGAEVPT